MKTLIFALLTCFALPLDACNAMYTGEVSTGTFIDKVCLYNHQGESVSITISSSTPCPTLIYVEH
jgi:hypothetical protein